MIHENFDIYDIHKHTQKVQVRRSRRLDEIILDAREIFGIGDRFIIMMVIRRRGVIVMFYCGLIRDHIHIATTAVLRLICACSYH